MLIDTPSVRAVALALSIAAGAAAPVASQERDSPFVIGEGHPERPADCRTISHWIDRAPDHSGRISLSIEGELVGVEWDGALAYLVVCEEPGVRVLCVTYGRDGLDVGDRVVLSGGYSRIDDRHVMLDPCLAAPP